MALLAVPALLDAWHLLPEKPGVLVVDGDGEAHPRGGMKIPAHFDALTDEITMGCAKKMLYGCSESNEEAGSTTLVYEKKKDDIIGWTFWSKNKVKPLFISQGNKMSMGDSLTIIKNYMGKYRKPESTKWAHDTVNLF